MSSSVSKIVAIISLLYGETPRLRKLSSVKKALLIYTVVFQFASCAIHQQKPIMKFPKDPPYVVINDENQTKERRSVLTRPAQEVRFPLSEEDAEVVKILEAKFDDEGNCAGLAAPQIGFSKQIIVFAAPADPLIKKWRPDFSQTMPKTIWLNPSYEPFGDEQHEDYEGCFSVDDLAGRVKRYKKIKYSAYTPDGTRVTGIAEGFLARIIQHETDHVKGILFTSYVSEDKLFSLTQYRKIRQAKMDGED